MACEKWRKNGGKLGLKRNIGNLEAWAKKPHVIGWVHPANQSESISQRARFSPEDSNRALPMGSRPKFSPWAFSFGIRETLFS